MVKNLPVNSGDIGDVGLIPGKGHGKPLHYSCLVYSPPIVPHSIFPNTIKLLFTSVNTDPLYNRLYYFSVNSLFFSQLLFQYPRCLSMERKDLPSTPSLPLAYSHPSYFNSNIVCFAKSSPPPNHLR